MNLKRLILLFVLGFFVPGLKAQTINYFQGTLEEAKTQARKEHKLIYILLETGTTTLPHISPYKSGQKDPGLIKQYNKGFICIYKSFIAKPGFEKIYESYDLQTYPSHIFLDQEGGLILKTTGFRSSVAPYIADLEKVKTLSKQKTITKFAVEYQKGNRDPGFLKSYLIKYGELDIPVNQALLDEYVNLLPISELDDFETILFIMQQGPILSGKAYKVSRLNQKFVDSIYRKLPSAQRIKMNNKIISCSMAEAKRRKDQNLAMLTANFVSGTWQSDWQKSLYMRSAKMMEYYEAVKDTSNYLRNASAYYHSYYNSLRDSIFRPETVQEMAARTTLAMQALRKRDSIVRDTAKRTLKTSTMMIGRLSSFSGMTDPKDRQRSKALEFASTLNNGAYSFYTMKTFNPEYLAKAVIWVQRSIDLFPENATYYDTLSHLYYRQKNYDEAIRIQQKAIDIVKERIKKSSDLLAKLSSQFPALSDFSIKEMGRYTTDLNKMKSKTL